MRLKLLAPVLGVTLSGFAVADTYQAEISGVATRSDSDYLYEDTNQYGITGRYYFNVVNTDNLPLAEAAFLGRSSNVFAGFEDVTRENGFASSQDYRVGAEFYIPENFLYVKAGVSRHSYRSTRDNDWFTTLGVVPIDGLLITTEYNSAYGYDANIHAKYLTELGGHYVNLEAGIADVGSHSTTIEIAGDFYFDNTFSVGGVISDNDAYGTASTLRTTKFFSEKLSGTFSYTDTRYGNELTVGLNLRF